METPVFRSSGELPSSTKRRAPALHDPGRQFRWPQRARYLRQIRAPQSCDHNEVASIEGVNIVAAAVIPLGVTALGVSIPLARLTADEGGVTVVVRSALLGKFFAGSRETRWIDGRVGWHVAWDSLDHVAVGPRSVLMYPTRERACRFATSRASKLVPLLDAFDRQGVRTENVSSTIGRSFGI